MLSVTTPVPFRARETDAMETWASRATSFSVALTRQPECVLQAPPLAALLWNRSGAYSA
jgi:hypothetical protein